MSYTRPVKYSGYELDDFALADLRIEVAVAERQAKEGPFYPEKDITPETLLAYAAKCRTAIDRFANGGAHDAVLKGIG